MGVMDGHGAHGHMVSGFVKETLPGVISDFINKKKIKDNDATFLPSIGSPGRQQKDEPEEPNQKWISNQNHRERDFSLKESFKITQKRLTEKTRIDSMFSGTTCVITLFNHEMIVCANSGDSRAILISEHTDFDNTQAANISRYYCT